MLSLGPTPTEAGPQADGLSLASLRPPRALPLPRPARLNRMRPTARVASGHQNRAGGHTPRSGDPMDSNPFSPWQKGEPAQAPPTTQPDPTTQQRGPREATAWLFLLSGYCFWNLQVSDGDATIPGWVNTNPRPGAQLRLS